MVPYTSTTQHMPTTPRTSCGHVPPSPRAPTTLMPPPTHPGEAPPPQSAAPCPPAGTAAAAAAAAALGQLPQQAAPSPPWGGCDQGSSRRSRRAPPRAWSSVSPTIRMASRVCLQDWRGGGVILQAGGGRQVHEAVPVQGRGEWRQREEAAREQQTSQTSQPWQQWQQQQQQEAALRGRCRASSGGDCTGGGRGRRRSSSSSSSSRPELLGIVHVGQVIAVGLQGWGWG